MASLNFKYIASQLSVEEVALEHGYQYVPESTCASWPVLKGRNGKIVIGTNGSDRDYYFNPLNRADKGNIITFVKNHLHMDYKKMQAFFLEKLGDVIYSSSAQDGSVVNRKEFSKSTAAIMPKPKKVVEPFDITKHNYRLLVDGDYRLLKYFNDVRCLSADIFFDERFATSVGVTGFAYGDKTIYNIAFPLEKVDTEQGKSVVVGLYQNGPRRNKETGKMESFKYFVKGSERGAGLWRSSITKDMLASKRIPLIVVESPIDAMSLYSLHKDKLANAMFVSPIGQISDRQIKEIEAVNRVLNHKLGRDLNDHSNVITAMDNDEHGLSFNIKVKTGIGQLKDIAGPSKVSIHPGINAEEVVIEVSYPKTTGSEKSLTAIAKMTDGLVVKLGPVNDNDPNTITRTIICSKDEHTIAKLDRNLSDVLGIASAYPKTKDWNEDLTRSSQINKTITQQF